MKRLQKRAENFNKIQLIKIFKPKPKPTTFSQRNGGILGLLLVLEILFSTNPLHCHYKGPIE
jgi:hypothetical protein